MNNLKKYQRFACTAVLLLVAVAVCLLAGAIWSRWENHIYLPTYFTKIDDQYFIVDAGHYRVLYSDDVKKPIFRWKTLDTDFYNPHSLAGHDGTLVADDTLNSRLKVYRRQGDDWTLSQIIPIADSGYPHFTAYDVDYGGYYVLDGRNDRMYVLRDNGTSVEIEKIVQLPDVTGYVRSFSILDGYLYVTAGIGSESIVQLDYRHDWAVVDKYYVPEEVRGMNALCRIGDFYYLTANTDAAWDPAPYIIRTNDLHHIDVAQRETVTNAVPYYFSKVDGKYYLTAYEDFTTYDENAIIELDSQEDGTLQAAGYVYFQRGHVSASDEVYRSKQS